MNIDKCITNKEWNEKHKKEIEQGDNMNRYQEFFDKIDSIREFFYSFHQKCEGRFHWFFLRKSRNLTDT